MRVVATEILNVYINFEYDVESGLYHLRARPYNPETGTFISPDPIGLRSGDLNFYRYVNNNPTNDIDLFGEGPLLALACELGLTIIDLVSFLSTTSEIDKLDRQISELNDIVNNAKTCSKDKRRAIIQRLKLEEKKFELIKSEASSQFKSRLLSPLSQSICALLLFVPGV